MVVRFDGEIFTLGKSLPLLPGKDDYISIFNGRDSGWKGAIQNYEVVKGAIQRRKGRGGTRHRKEIQRFYGYARI